MARRHRRMEILGGGEVYSIILEPPVWSYPHIALVIFIVVVMTIGLIDELSGDRFLTAIIGPPPDVSSPHAVIVLR